MSTSVEQRVVQMKFDNKQFESGVAQSMSTLDKLKEKLNFKGVAKSFEQISDAADDVSFKGLIEGTEEVSRKFDAMSVVAFTVFNRITNWAIDTGKNLVKSLSVDQVTSGWSKYEARVASVQTLVNATGKSVAEIEKYMDKLMLYSDETSYGFDDMTSSLATMVSAGGDIEKLIPLLEGFGNATSFVGKGAAEYKRAVIQLSQAYGAGAMQLQDWKSIEQTLGGAKQLKEIFIEVAEEIGTINKKGSITIGNFNESLQKKWLTSEVMEEALGRFAEMTETAFAMIDEGIVDSVSDAYAILGEYTDDYRIKAARAAQEAKSFTEAIDATKDAVSTKWMESFQIIFGNYEEATKLWTELVDTLWDLFAASGDTRNEILQVWRSFEGREAMIEAVKAAFNALYTPVKAVKDAIHEIFFPGSVEEKGEWLANATKSVRDFFQAITMSEEAANNLKTAIKLLLIPVYAFYQVLRVIGTVIVQTIVLIFAFANALLELPSRLMSIESPLKRVFGEERYARLMAALTTIVESLGAAFIAVGSAIVTIGKSIASAFSSKFSGVLSKLFDLLAPIAGWILDRIVDGFEYLANLNYDKIVGWVATGLGTVIDGFQIILNWSYKALGGVKEFFKSFLTLSPKEMLQAIIDALKNMRSTLIDLAKNLGFDRIFDSMANSGGGLVNVLKSLGAAIVDFIQKLTPGKVLVFSFGVSLVWMFTQISKALSTFTSFAGNVVGAIGEVRNTLIAYQKKLKGSPILQVALAISVLAVSLGYLAALDSDRLIRASIALSILVGAMTIMIGVVTIISKLAAKSEGMADALGKISAAFLAVGVAIAAVTAALFILDKIDIDNLGWSLVALGTSVLILMGALAALSHIMKGNTTLAASIYILAFAKAMNMMVKALEKISKAELQYSIDTIVTVGVIVSLMLALGAASKFLKFSSGLSMVMFAASILLFVKVLKPISDIDMSMALQALTYVVLMMVPMAAIGLMAKALKGEAITQLIKVSVALLILYVAIKNIGSLDQKVVIQGGVVVGAVLAFVVALVAVHNLTKGGEMIKLQGSFIALSVAILILGVAIDYIGNIKLANVIQGTVIVLALIGLLSYLAVAMSFAKEATSVVVVLGICLCLLMSSIVLLTLIEPAELYRSTASIAAIMVSLSLVFKSLHNMKGKEALKAVAGISAVLIEVGAIFVLLDHFGNGKDHLKNAEAIGLVLAALAVSFAIIDKGTANASGPVDWERYGNTMATIGGILALTYLALLGLDKTIGDDAGNLINKAAALGLILLELSVALRIMSTAAEASNDADVGGYTTLGVLTGALAAVSAGILTWLDQLTIDESSVTKIKAFEVILAEMALCVYQLAKVSSSFDEFGGSNVGGFGTVLGLVLGLSAATTGILIWLNYLSNFDESMDIKIKGFMSILTIMSLCVAALAVVSEKLGSFNTNTFGGFAGLSVLIGLLSAGTVGLLAWLNSLKDFNESMLTKLLSFASVMVVMTLCIDMLALVGSKLAVMGGANFINTITGGIAAVALLALLALTIVGLGYFFNWLDSLEPALDAAEAVITRLGRIIGEFVGEVIGGFAVGLEGGLGAAIKQFGTDLSQFAENVKPFTELKIDPNLPTAMGYLAAAALAITGEEIASAIFEFWTGGSTLASFGEDLGEFALAFSKFIDEVDASVSDTDLDKVEAVSTCLSSIAAVLANIPTEGGLMGAIFGEKDLAGFGEGLGKVAEGVITYVTAFDEIEYDQDKVDKINNVTKTLIEMSRMLPKTGGLVSWLGEQDFGKFGSQIKAYGEALKSFMETSNETADIYDDGVNFDIIKNATQALIDLAQQVPEIGYFTWWFEGMQDIGTFGKQIKGYGEGLRDFFEIFKDVTVEFGGRTIRHKIINQDTVDSAVMAGEAFAQLAQSIPSTGGWVSFFTGKEGDLASFGKNIKKYGDGLAGFFTALKDVGLSRGTIDDAAYAGTEFATLIDKIDADKVESGWFSNSAFEDFSIGVAFLGAGIAAFYEKAKLVTDWDLVGDAVKYVVALAGLSSTISSGMNETNAVKFNTYLAALAGSGVTAFTDAFTNAKTDMADSIKSTLEATLSLANYKFRTTTKAFKGFIDLVVEAIEGSDKDISKKIKDTIDLVTKTIVNDLPRFYDTGNRITAALLLGMASGNSDVDDIITELFTNMIVEVHTVTGYKNGKSEVFRDIGQSCVDGFTKGLDDKETELVSKANSVSSKLADTFEKALGINSPSKRFAEIGMYTMLGFQKGIEDNEAGSINAMVKMGGNLLDAIKEFYGIHSPSTVMKNEVGIWIIRGIADGITEDMSAEDAAAKKAQNIMSAFQNEFNKWSADINLSDLEYKLWETVNRNAADAEKHAQEITNLEEKLTYQAQRYNASVAQFKMVSDIGDADAIKDAKATMIKEETTLYEIANNLADLKNTVEEQADSSTLMSAIDSESNLWKTMNRNATDAEVRSHDIGVIEEKLAYKAEIVAEAEKTYQEALATYGESAKVTQEARISYIDAQNDLWDFSNQLADLMNYAEEQIDWSLHISSIDIEDNLWKAMNKSATEAETRAHEIDVIQQKLAYKAEIVADAEKTYQEALAVYGESSKVTQEAKNAYAEAQIDLLDFADQLADLINYVEEQVDWSLKITTADLENTLWETMHQDATDKEKNAQQEKLLNEKLSYQAEIVSEAEKNYQEALELYGETAKVTQEAYNTYLQAQNSLWELANSLADLLNPEEEERDWDAFGKEAYASFDEIIRYFQKDIENGKMTLEEAGDLAAKMSGVAEYQEHLLQTSTKDKITSADIVEDAMANVKGTTKIKNQVDAAEIVDDVMSNVKGLDQPINQIDPADIVKDALSNVQITIDAKELVAPNDLVKDALSNIDNITVDDVRYVVIEDPKVCNVATTDDEIDKDKKSSNLSEDDIDEKIKKAAESETEGVLNGLGGSSGRDTPYDEDLLAQAMADYGVDFDSTNALGLDFGNMLGGGLLDGFREKLGGMGDALTNLVGSAFGTLKEKLGFGKNTSGDLGDSWNDLKDAFGNFTGSAIEESEPKITDATSNLASAGIAAAGALPEGMENVGTQASLGLAKGIRESSEAPVNAIGELVGNVINKTRSDLDVHSPSRLYYEIGEMVNQGFANGLIGSTDVVVDAVESVLSDAQNTIGESPFEAAITPVLDDSSGKTSQYLSYGPGGTVTPSGYSVSTGWWTSDIASSVQQLTAIEEARRLHEEEAFAEYKQSIDELKSTIQAMADNPGINYTQNNYSPAALNASTIYRNTRTALARASAKASPTGRSLGSN